MIFAIRPVDGTGDQRGEAEWKRWGKRGDKPMKKRGAHRAVGDHPSQGNDGGLCTMRPAVANGPFLGP